MTPFLPYRILVSMRPQGVIIIDLDHSIHSSIQPMRRLIQNISFDKAVWRDLAAAGAARLRSIRFMMKAASPGNSGSAASTRRGTVPRILIRAGRRRPGFVFPAIQTDPDGTSGHRRFLSAAPYGREVLMLFFNIDCVDRRPAPIGIPGRLPHPASGRGRASPRTTLLSRL